jgi:hypothetical protein
MTIQRRRREFKIPVRKEKTFFFFFFYRTHKTHTHTQTQTIRIIIKKFWFSFLFGWEIFFSLVLISSLLKNKEMGGIVWGYKHCTIFHSKKKFGNCSLFFLILLLNLYELFACVCVCVPFTKTNNVEIHSKLTWFGSLLYRWRGISNFWIIIFNFSLTFFFSSYVGPIKNLRVSVFACISYVNVCVCVHQNECKLIISVLAGVLFFFHGKNYEKLTDIRQR